MTISYVPSAGLVLLVRLVVLVGFSHNRGCCRISPLLLLDGSNAHLGQGGKHLVLERPEELLLADALILSKSP